MASIAVVICVTRHVTIRGLPSGCGTWGLYTPRPPLSGALVPEILRFGLSIVAGMRLEPHPSGGHHLKVMWTALMSAVRPEPWQTMHCSTLRSAVARASLKDPPLPWKWAMAAGVSWQLEQ